MGHNIYHYLYIPLTFYHTAPIGVALVYSPLIHHYGKPSAAQPYNQKPPRFSWGWDNCMCILPGFVMLDLGVGSCLVGDGEEVWYHDVNVNIYACC